MPEPQPEPQKLPSLPSKKAEVPPAAEAAKFEKPKPDVFVSANEAGKKEAAEREKTSPSRTSSRRGSYQRQNPVVKVLTSATFIRGVLGVLKKVIR